MKTQMGAEARILALEKQVKALAAKVKRHQAIFDAMTNAPNATTGLIVQRAGPRLRGGRRQYID